jgi:hypothetical protein
MKPNSPATATNATFGRRELIAIWLSAAILLSAVIYWIVQIKGVTEMLKLAYG